MFHLNSSLHCGSATWDTNFARTYLQISEDQLVKLNKIPGCSKTENSEKIATENDKTSDNIEKHLTQRASTSTESLSTTKTNTSAKNNALEIQNYNSDLQFKSKPITPSTEKEAFLKNVSLSPIKKKFTSTYSLQRSTSLPDLYEKLLSPIKSAEINRKRVHSIEKDISSIELPPVLTKDHFNETYTVFVASNGGINHDKLLKINSRQSASCPLEYPNWFSKQKKLKTLDDSILNHNYLKGIEKSVAVSLPSVGPVKTTLQQEMSLLGKKLLLLEKRFSPSKEMNNPPLTTNLLNVENLNCQKNMNSSQAPAPVDQVVTAVPSSDAAEIFDEIQTSSLPKSHKSLVLQSNSQLLSQKFDAPKNTFESAQDSTANVPKTTVCYFESFLSPPIPCGQLTPSDVPTLSQPISSQQSVELNTHIASPPVTYEQPLPTKVFAPYQPVPPQKLGRLITPNESQNTELSGKIVVPENPSATCIPVPPLKLPKLGTPNESQNTELSGKIGVPEKPSGTFSVFSANSNEKVPELASSKELGAKRKRKNRSEKSSKKLDVKKLKRTDIQFSSAQIKNMIEILKIFHTEF